MAGGVEMTPFFLAFVSFAVLLGVLEHVVMSRWGR